MKKRLIALFITASVTLSLSSACAFWVTPTEDQNVYASPSGDSVCKTVLYKGSSTEVIESLDNGWYKVKVNKKTGYITTENTVASKKQPDPAGAYIYYSFDRQTDYPKVAYTTRKGLPKGATIASGGCAPTTIGNILRNACHNPEATTENMCKLAVSSGARYNGGTHADVLLKAAKKKWGNFTYVRTTSADKMLKHVANGGMAVAKTYGGYSGSASLFAYSAHYVAIVGQKNSMRLAVMDPYYYKGKWTATQARRHSITTTSVKGLVYAKTRMVRKACCEYYLITPTS